MCCKCGEKGHIARNCRTGNVRGAKRERSWSSGSNNRWRATQYYEKSWNRNAFTNSTTKSKLNMSGTTKTRTILYDGGQGKAWHGKARHVVHGSLWTGLKMQSNCSTFLMYQTGYWARYRPMEDEVNERDRVGENRRSC